MITQNNRRNVRHRQRLRVMFGHTSSFTIDVCAGGFCTELMRAMQPGSDVEGSIHVNGKEVAFGGQVVWVKRGASGLNLRSRMGVRFTRVPWDLQRLIGSPRLQ